MQLELSKIRNDGGTQPREMYHPDTLDEYAADMANGVVFPPITVFYDGVDYWLVDGFHRVSAARHIGFETIEADVRQGTLEQAQWFSYSVNATHGQRRTDGDKRRAVEAALKHPKAAEMSNYDIAKHCGVDESFVRLCEKEVKKVSTEHSVDRPTTRTVTRKGKTYTQNTSNIGKSKSNKPKAGKPAKQASANGHNDEPIPDEPKPAPAPSQAEPAATSVVDTYTIPLPVDVEGAAEVLIREFTAEERRRLIELLTASIAVDV